MTWVLTDRLRIGRTLYVGALALVTAALTTGYLVWSGIGADFWTSNWAWGIFGAFVAGGMLVLALQRARLGTPQPRRPGALTAFWESVVYGAAEGVLLSLLPALVMWQALAAVGWTTGALVMAAGAIAFATTLVVIVVHHLGYASFRNRRMVQAIMGCAPLSLAYLLTGSPIAPTVGHMLLHGEVLRQRFELPPEGETKDGDELQLVEAA